MFTHGNAFAERPLPSLRARRVRPVQSASALALGGTLALASREALTKNKTKRSKSDEETRIQTCIQMCLR